MKTVWIATGNPHKTEEFAAMLGENVKVKTLKDLDCEPVIDESGKTFEENALIKARALHEIVHESVMSDDSGLEVDALDGAPGIYSARFMGEDTDYTIKNNAILDAIKDKTGEERSARFVCAIAWIEADGTEHVYRGTMEGYINDSIKGEHGFGYDPIFYYPPFGTTSADVDPAIKNAASHRHNALVQLEADWSK